MKEIYSNVLENHVSLPVDFLGRRKERKEQWGGGGFACPRHPESSVGGAAGQVMGPFRSLLVTGSVIIYSRYAAPWWWWRRGGAAGAAEVEG